MARRAWASPEDVLNTRGVEELRRFSGGIGQGERGREDRVRVAHIVARPDAGPTAGACRDPADLFQHHAPDHSERSRARDRAAQEPADRRGAREGSGVHGWSGTNAIRLGTPRETRRQACDTGAPQDPRRKLEFRASGFRLQAWSPESGARSRTSSGTFILHRPPTRPHRERATKPTSRPSRALPRAPRVPTAHDHRPPHEVS